MKVGDSLILFNGDGHNYTGVISELSKKQSCVQILDNNQATNESPLHIHLYQPLCRSEKMDWCIQKATELGVSEITPYVSSRVNINIPADRLNKKILHWNSVIQSACEQSGRSTIPTIHSPHPFHDLILTSGTQDHIKIIASPAAEKNFNELINKNYGHCICAIGPEGGFDKKELALAESNGFIGTQLGPRVLRLETAVITAITICQLHWGDMN